MHKDDRKNGLPVDVDAIKRKVPNMGKFNI